jgi:choline monooxygenase
MPFEIDADIRKASTPSADWYLDPCAFEQSKAKVFARSWQFITDEDGLKAPGQVLPFTLLEGMLDEPLIISRDEKDELHCLSNVCTHRGNIVVEGAGVEKSLRCRYHGRRFGLDGKFQFMPEFEGCEGFPSEKDNLTQVSLSKWSKFLFVSPQPECCLDEWITPMSERISWLPLNEFRYEPSRSRDYLVRGHWALYVDNYLEGFHIPYIHSGLSETLDYGKYSTELFKFGTLQLGVAKSGEDHFDLPKSSPDFGQEISAYYYWIFPNLMFNFYPWGLSINVVKPLARDLTRVSFFPYVWRPDRMSSGAGAELDRVEREDEAVVEMVQKGLRSRYYDRGRYSPTRETGTHHFHRLLQRFLG